MPPIARASLALLLGLGACGLPDGTVIEASEAARAAPPPTLLPTAEFAAIGAGAAADVRRIEDGTDALAARAAALQARAAALGAPVIPQRDRERLEAAAAAP